MTRQDRVINILRKYLTLVSSLAASLLKNKFLDLLLLSTCKSEQPGCFPFPAVIYIHRFARPPAVREVRTGYTSNEVTANPPQRIYGEQSCLLRTCAVSICMAATVKTPCSWRHGLELDQRWHQPLEMLQMLTDSSTSAFVPDGAANPDLCLPEGQTCDLFIVFDSEDKRIPHIRKPWDGRFSFMLNLFTLICLWFSISSGDILTIIILNILIILINIIIRLADISLSRWHPSKWMSLKGLEFNCNRSC